MDKRLMLAIVLSLTVVLVWAIFFGTKDVEAIEEF